MKRGRAAVAWGLAATLLASALLAMAVGWNPYRADRVRGIDVSHHQGVIDWERVAGDDVVFTYIKATEGGDFIDPRFAVNWRQSHDAGLRRGAYHFFTRCRSGRAQAENFIRQVPREVGTLPHALDLEHVGPCRDAPTRDVVPEALAFLDRLESHYGRRPLVYTTEPYDRQFLRTLTGERFWLRSMFWPPSYRAAMWDVWQTSGSGRVDGIAGPVDVNLFRGERAAFDAWAAGS